MKKSVAIITARGGSKRIPRKNIKNFLGQPIIKYSIDAALNSCCFDEVMVSTDDDEIADMAVSFGAKIPFKRSAKNADDFSTTADVVAEVIESYAEKGKYFDYCCCIYPTAPFVTAEKLQLAFQKIKENNAWSVIPIVKFSFPILRSFKVEDGLVKMNWPEYMSSKSQDLPASYHDCGQFYFLDVAAFKTHKKLFTENTVPIEMSELEVQDIDTVEDWKIAEIKYKLMEDGRNSQLWNG